MAGLNVNLADDGDWTPALTLAVGEQNKAAVLNLQLQDTDGTGQTYKFNLRALKPGAAQRITAEFGASLAEPQNIEKPGTIPGLGPVVNCMVIGEWSGNAVQVVLSGVKSEDKDKPRHEVKDGNHESGAVTRMRATGGLGTGSKRTPRKATRSTRR